MAVSCRSADFLKSLWPPSVAGITKVLIPADNEQDLDDVADEVKNKLEIVPVKKVTEVLKLVLK